jgi:hypothetical protein
MLSPWSWKKNSLRWGKRWARLRPRLAGRGLASLGLDRSRLELVAKPEHFVELRRGTVGAESTVEVLGLHGRHF